METKILLSVEKLTKPFKQMINKLENYAKVDVVYDDNYSLKDYDLFIGKRLSADKLVDANKLKHILAYKTGVEDFPLKELAKRNITLSNSHADSKIIAYFAFSLANSLVSLINQYDSKLKKGIWETPFYQNIFSLKIGLLGYGHIGKEIHKLFRPYKTAIYTINRHHKYPKDLHLVNSLKQLVSKCDVIIASLPNTLETNNLFTKEILDLMTNKYLVNVGRPNIIDEKDLYEYLKEHKIKGVATDCLKIRNKDVSKIVKPSIYPLETLDNLIMTPHVATNIIDGQKRYVKDVTSMVLNLILKNKLSNVVSYQKGY